MRSVRRTAEFDAKAMRLFPPVAGRDWSRYQQFLDTIVHPAGTRLAGSWDRYANDDGDLALIVMRDDEFADVIIFARVLNDEIVLWNFLSDDERRHNQGVMAGDQRAAHG
jgi:hypothetical protein